MEKIICVFGDSITWGALDQEKGGWTNRLKIFFGFLDNEYRDKVVVHNLGVDTNTTKDLLKRFENESRERYWDGSKNKDFKKDNICIFEIGKNDSIYVKTKDKPWVAIKEFEDNLIELIGRAGTFSSNVIFLGLAHVDETKTIPWEKTGESYDNENIEKYNSVLEKVCQDSEVHFINIMNLLNTEDLEDGVHPNSVGHQKIFEAVQKFLKSNKFL